MGDGEMDRIQLIKKFEFGSGEELPNTNSVEMQKYKSFDNLNTNIQKQNDLLCIEIDSVKNYDVYFPNQNIENLIEMINLMARKKERKLKNFFIFQSFKRSNKKLQLNGINRKKMKKQSYHDDFLHKNDEIVQTNPKNHGKLLKELSPKIIGRKNMKKRSSIKPISYFLKLCDLFVRIYNKVSKICHFKLSLKREQH